MNQSDANAPRTIEVKLQLIGGHQHIVKLRENAPELVDLFRVLASRGSAAATEQFFQLPMEGGQTACSFHSQQLISVITKPPVVIELQVPQKTPQTVPQPETQSSQQSEPQAQTKTTLVRPAQHLLIDDFLSEDEHRDMLDYALANEQRFERGTVVGRESVHRRNLVIMDFNNSTQAVRLNNRLLVLYPYITKTLELPIQALKTTEPQLTASNDGHYYRRHSDRGYNDTNESAQTRALSCIYYFFRQPKGFSGGELRLFDRVEQDGRTYAAESFQQIEPVSNRLVVFPSDSVHELRPIRCPSRQFADSRFAITNWLHRAEQPDPEAGFGWGHFRCGVVPNGFN